MKQWAVITEKQNETWLKPMPDKETAVAEAAKMFKALSKHDKHNCRIIAGLVNLDDQGNFVELPNGTCDGEVYEIALMLKGEPSWSHPRIKS